MTVLKPAFAAAAAAALAACASTPPPANEALDQARAAYRTAQADPHVKQFAAPELDQAGRTLNRAEALWRSQSDAERIAHRAYLAEQQARIARRTAMLRAAEEEVAQASARRERAVLEARARAAEAQRDRAQAEREQAEARLREMQAAREAAAGAQQSQRLAEAEELGAELRRLETQVSELDARQTERGWVVRVGNHFLFDVGESTLKPGGRRALESVVRFLREHPERNVVIEGFTDSTGSRELNRHLSERRAKEVRNALVLAGIDADRIEARGLGASFPVASNDTTAGRQLNRRVEILFPRDAGAATGGSR